MNLNRGSNKIYLGQGSKLKTQSSKLPRGLTLIETVVGLSIVSILVMTFGVSLIAAAQAQRAKLNNLAAALADEQLAVLRTMIASTIPPQSSGPPIGLLFSQGTWSEIVSGAAVSAPRVLSAGPTGTSGVTSLMPLPKNAYDDFTLTASFRVLSGSPAAWQAGLLFRCADLQNCYEAYLTADHLYLKKVVGGSETVLYSDVRSIAYDSWQALSVTASGPSISVSLNGVPVASRTDNSFSVGKAALALWNGPNAYFDDTSIGGTTWNFDVEYPGQLPPDWYRFGLADLPAGAMSVAVERPFNDDNIKRYTVTVSWTDRSGAKSLQRAALSSY